MKKILHHCGLRKVHSLRTPPLLEKTMLDYGLLSLHSPMQDMSVSFLSFPVKTVRAVFSDLPKVVRISIFSLMARIGTVRVLQWTN